MENPQNKLSLFPASVDLLVMMSDDMDLLREYARHKSEEAFATLVSRHINLVYSVALRQVGDAHQAEEISQVVFIILARKAESLSPKTVLAGWLCRTARHVSARAFTMRQRRLIREQEAYMQSLTDSPESDAWNHIAPLLDSALAQLRGKDHDAVVLRFFEGKSFKEVGAAIGTSEDTAKKRVTRTLEKLRRFFLKRGVALSTAVIAGAVAANSVQAAPAALAKSVTVAALAKGALASGSTLTLIKGALKLMAWTKMKTAVVVGVGLLLAVGVTPVTVKKVRQHREQATWASVTHVMDEMNGAGGMRASADRDWNALPPTIAFRPTGFGGRYGDEAFIRGGKNNRMVGISMPVAALLVHTFEIGRMRIVNREGLPSGKYDFLVSVPNRPAVMKTEIKKQLGLDISKQVINTNVLLLTIARPNAPALTPVPDDAPQRKIRGPAGHARFGTIGALRQFAELRLKIPVIDVTGLTNKYDMDFAWNQKEADTDPEALKQAMLDQLGVQFIPTNQDLEMIVWKK